VGQWLFKRFSIELSIKETKLEVDRGKVLDRPLYIKQGSGDFSFPNKVKCSLPCLITQPKVKVHFLDLGRLKKGEYQRGKIQRAVSSLWYQKNDHTKTGDAWIPGDSNNNCEGWKAGGHAGLMYFSLPCATWYRGKLFENT